MKDYCTQNNGDCATCSLTNYMRDCRNNPIDIPEDNELSNWDQANKHGLGAAAERDIYNLMPEWVLELDPDKISDLILAMHKNHQAGKAIQYAEDKEYIDALTDNAKKV